MKRFTRAFRQLHGNMKSYGVLSQSICRVPPVKKKQHTKVNTRLLTCVVEVQPSVDGRCSVGLDEPRGAGPGLSGPTAERREVKVAGEPHVRWNEKEV